MISIPVLKEPTVLPVPLVLLTLTNVQLVVSGITAQVLLCLHLRNVQLVITMTTLSMLFIVICVPLVILVHKLTLTQFHVQ